MNSKPLGAQSMLNVIQTTRRRMLLGLAAASTAAATGANAEGRTTAQEDPELVAMGDRLGDALSDYKLATERVRTIADTWGPEWPVPDPAIYRYGEDCKTHCDILGRGVKMPWGNGGIQRVHDLGTPEHFEKSAARYWKEYERCMGFKTQRGAKGAKAWAEHDQAAIKPARAYWSEVERITKVSGIEAAQEAETAAMNSLKELVGQIILYREKTITGLIIKAQALQTWAQVELFFQKFNPEAAIWSEAMSETVLRQTSASVV